MVPRAAGDFSLVAKNGQLDIIVALQCTRKGQKSLNDFSHKTAMVVSAITCLGLSL